MKSRLLVIITILILVCSLVIPNQQVAASGFNVTYILILEQEDKPFIEIQVRGYPEPNAIFNFLGTMVKNVSSLRNVFQEIEVKDLAGNKLSWYWLNQGINVTNGRIKDFTISYTIDAINFQPGQNNDPSIQKNTLFRFRRIFFIAGDVFLTPKLEPESIKVNYSLPKGTTLYSSLPSEGETFKVIKNLWGSLLADFGMAYFAGGHALFTLSHTTDWGDKYQYIWFDRDPLSDSWTPFYGNTPWEQAKLYMESTESCARYFREAIGPLPSHRVLFTNVIPQYSGFPSAGTNQDSYHYMQIWPRYSEPEVCHHVFHQYSFGFPEQSKLVFSGGSVGNMLWEGLSTYYEQILPSLLFSDQRYSGKLFEFYALDVRGIPFGIRQNLNNHIKYNLSALRVYLLDQFIRNKTNGIESLDSFVKAMWENVKDNFVPGFISQSDVLSAFSNVVGAENAYYLNQVANMSSFDLVALKDLRSPFSAYADWMTQEYFWGKPLLFYIYLDIAAAKGSEWPHFATYPHNLIRYRSQALPPVWDYLSTRKERPLTRKDIIDAMHAATGKNHSGFFEFWESLGVTLEPNEIADLANWNPRDHDPQDLLPSTFNSVGTLKTEHLLGGIPQQATIHLDNSTPKNQIFIEYQYIQGGSNFDLEKAGKVFQGDNVQVIRPYSQPYGKLNITGVIFVVTTKDPTNQDYPITLTYPLGNGVSRFAIKLDAQGEQLGDLYYLGSIQPITFMLEKINNQYILPDTPLENETFQAVIEGKNEQYQPGDKILLSLLSGPVKIRLFDQYGFLRGLSSVIPANLP